MIGLSTGMQVWCNICDVHLGMTRLRGDNNLASHLRSAVGIPLMESVDSNFDSKEQKQPRHHHSAHADISTTSGPAQCNYYSNATAAQPSLSQEDKDWSSSSSWIRLGHFVRGG